MDSIRQLRSSQTRTLINTFLKTSTIFQLFLLLISLDSFALPGWQAGVPQWFTQRKVPNRVISIDFDSQNQLNTSFRIAVRENRLDNAQHFLFQGAEVDSRSPEGETALMYASRNCSYKAVNLLLENKADINLRDEAGRTALIYAARESCVKVVRLLLKSSVIEANVKDNMRKTALDYAYKTSLLEVDGLAEAIIKILQYHSKTTSS
jgi:ankyrin repeat protein